MRTICFYLPQFHPIPENDRWWGKGFTEWTNVARAQPRFEGHYQPHLPADLGFYDLRLADTRVAQAELARAYGIHGFCYYHYWFNGRRLLERPFNEVLQSGQPRLPFCLCWANENWTRRWDGEEKEVLMEQKYSLEDDRAHLRSLLPAFRDDRYIRINGKPLFLVYRTDWLPEPRRTAEVWREEAKRGGVDDLYLVRVESISSTNAVSPDSIGFDAAVEFAPDWKKRGPLLHQDRNRFHRALARRGMIKDAYFDNSVSQYDDLVGAMSAKEVPNYRWFRCVAPSWDNTSRRKSGANIFVGSTPEKFERWLASAASYTRKTFQGEEQLLFINAWNEWAEGCHLEPDIKFGRQYLEAAKRVLNGRPN